MITVPDLVKKTDKFFMGNSGKINAELTKKQKVRNSPRILSFLEKYLYIKEHYADGTFMLSNGTIDPEFRAIYLDFYTIVVGQQVTEAFIDEYFALLKESKEWGENWDEHAMHGYVAARLEPFLFPSKNGDKKKKYQYSFISKLLHTANNELPIYDQNVWKVVEETGSPAGTPQMPYARRINYFVSTLDVIGNLYKDLAQDPTFIELTEKVKCFSGLDISFAKKCDFIFWVMGK